MDAAVCPPAGDLVTWGLFSGCPHQAASDKGKPVTEDFLLAKGGSTALCKSVKEPNRQSPQFLSSRKPPMQAAKEHLHDGPWARRERKESLQSPQLTTVLHHLTLADEAFIAHPFAAHYVVKYQLYQLSSVC